MVGLPANSVQRIADRRRQAESELTGRISVIEEANDLAPYLLAFRAFVVALFDSEAEELLHVCEDSESYERILRDEVAIRILEGIIGDRSRKTAKERRSPEVRQPFTEQEIGCEAIWETGTDGRRTPAVEGILEEHAQHGDWERFMPRHIGCCIRSRDNGRVREELSWVLRKRVFYWVGQFPARVNEERGRVERTDAIPSDGQQHEPHQASRLNVELINKWIEEEGYQNKDLADALKITVRVVSSLRRNGKCHGAKAVTKLANLMKRDVSDLYVL